MGKKAVGSPHTSIGKKRGGKREESKGEGGERTDERQHLFSEGYEKEGRTVKGEQKGH